MCDQTSDVVHRAAVDLAVSTVRTALTTERIDAQELLAAVTTDENVLKALHEPIATFVTLQVGDKLRGCIGTLLPLLPLYSDIVKNATKAMSDPRMSPVRPSEWPQLSVSVAILSQPEALEADSFESLYTQLRPGVDGLTLRHNGKRATFLPSVWAKLDEPKQFVAGLLRKGGWDPVELPFGMRAERYSTINVHSRPPRAELVQP